MKSEKPIFGENVKGIEIDSQTRCAHWRGERDIIAIKFKCCAKYFSCYDCHLNLENHQPEVWAENEFETKAVLCGNCGHQLSINEYLACNAHCPRCESGFNPGCAKHYHLYFKI